MNKKISLGGAITLAIMFSTVTFIMTMIYAQNDFNGKVYDLQQREKMYAKLSEVDSKVRKEYYGTIDEEKLRDHIVQGYVKGLGDAYGMYMTAEQYAETMSGFDGKMVDLGITPAQDASGYMLVNDIVIGSPAEVAGIAKGDLVIKVDELEVNAEQYSAAVDALKGEPGSTLTLLVRRGSTEKTYSVTRRRMEILSADYRLHGNVGYIRITEFNDNTTAQFKRALDALIAESVGGLVLDVRNNPGGTMESVSGILDILLPEGPIVSATDKAGNTTVLHQSNADEITLPMVVLINGKSASAAELFAQALKDYGKGKTVGSTTYGKGSMQRIYQLSDGSALDITVAHYNPPYSKNFDGVGVKPDYEVKLSAELEQNLDALDESSDTQLKKALEVVAAQMKNEGVTPEIESSQPDSNVMEGTVTEEEEIEGEDVDAETESSSSSESSSASSSSKSSSKAK